MAKSKSTTAEQKAKATVRRLRADLEQSEVKRAGWKKRAKAAEAVVADLQAQLREVDKQAGKAGTAGRARKKAPTKARAGAAAPTAAAPDPGAAATEDTRSPDASWTVAQLRAEAGRRGISGLSNKPKAELVKALG